MGGFLVALAAVGIFAAYTGATADTRQRYVASRADLPIGHRIERADLAVLPMDLPAEVGSRAARDPSRLVGMIVIGPVAKGELVQASDVAAAGGEGATGPQVSFPIDSARALAGRLRVGELVDVVATYDAAGSGQTLVVARGARVVDRSKPTSTLGDGGKEVVTLAVASRAETLAVAHAANAGDVTLVRVTGQPAQPGRAETNTYQGPASKPASTSPTG